MAYQKLDKEGILKGELIHRTLVKDVWKYFNVSHLAKDCGLDSRTVKNWLQTFKNIDAGLPTVCLCCGAEQLGLYNQIIRAEARK